ncbi:MAG TPA: O-antigen ligase family protein [Eoetvoesiella sp.]
MNTTVSRNNVLAVIVSASIFLFFALNQSAPSGYSAGAALLLLTSLYFLAMRPALGLSTQDKIIIGILLSLFLIAVFMLILHGNRSRTLDPSTRYLAAIPILLLLLSVRMRLCWLWAGLVAGCVSAAGISLWQVELQGLERAEGFTNAIQFGDIVLSMSMLCAAGLFWTGAQGPHAKRWQAALIVGILAGFYSFVASGTRGGWLAVPPMMLLFAIAFLTRKNLKRTLLGGSALILAFGISVAMVPNNSIKRGYDAAISNIDDYLKTHNAESSVGGRLEMWRMAYINIPQRPILGWSDKDYAAQLQRLVDEGKAHPRVLRLGHAHNNYLQEWIRQGLVGLLALLALYFIPFWYFCQRLASPSRNVRVMAVCGTTVLSSFFVYSMTQYVLGHNDGIMFLVMGLVIFWAGMRNEEQKVLAA